MADADPSSLQILSAALKDRARQEGFEPVGIANLPGSRRLQMRTEALQRWLNQGLAADMAWMAAPRRLEAAQLLDGAKSVLAVGLNYYVDQQTQPGHLKIARYAWGRDYHRVVDQRLRRVGRWLSERCPNVRWRVCVDSAPLLDKAWAEEAGLGWIGKHSNLINSTRGSWMVLGHLLITERLQADEPARSLCGRCTACMQACPTEAIREPFVVDASAVWQITQSKTATPSCHRRSRMPLDPGWQAVTSARTSVPGITTACRRQRSPICNRGPGCCS